MVNVPAVFIETLKSMEPPLLTLVADAYPLIWLFVSSDKAKPAFGSSHWEVPGCWFSVTIGLAVTVVAVAVGVAVAVAVGVMVAVAVAVRVAVAVGVAVEVGVAVGVFVGVGVLVGNNGGIRSVGNGSGGPICGRPWAMAGPAGPTPSTSTPVTRSKRRSCRLIRLNSLYACTADPFSRPSGISCVVPLAWAGVLVGTAIMVAALSAACAVYST